MPRKQSFSGSMNHIGKLIHSTLSIDEIMRRVIVQAAQAVGSETAAISLRQGDHWVVSYVHGFPQDVIGAQMDDQQEPHAMLAVKTGKPVVIDDALTDERVNRAHMKKWGVHSVLVVPLRAEDQVIGVLFFNRHKPGVPFQKSHIEFADQLASSLSLALRNARLLERLRTELAERKTAEQALQKPHELLQARTEELQTQAEELREGEQTPHRLNQELEQRVAARTAQLAQASEAIQAERQRFNQVLETLPAYLVLLTPDYHVAFANRFFRERFGESHGRRCFEYLFQRTEPCEICDTYKTLKTNAPQRWEWTGPDGHQYDIYDFPFTDTDGSPLIMEVGLDITEQKRAQAALTEANETLEQRVIERTTALQEVNERLQAQSEELRAANEELQAQQEELRAQTEELRASEESLRESEQRYRSLFENMLDGYAYCQMLFDNRGRPTDFLYLDVNDAFTKLTGLENVVGKKATEVIPTIRASHPELLETYGRVAQTGRPVRFEIEFKPLGIWLSISVYSPRRGYFTAVFDNITERKRAAEALQKANELLQMQKGELQAQSEELQTQTEELQAQTQELTTTNGELRESEKALQESEGRFRVLTANLSSGVALIDEDGKFTLYNPAFLRMFGLAENSSIRNINDQDWGQWQVFEPDGTLLHVDDHPVRKAALTGQAVKNKLVGVRLPAGGDLTWMLISAEPIPRANGHHAIICTYHDVTEQKRMEQTLREWNATLEGKVAQRTAQLEDRARQLQKLTLELSQTEDRERKRMADILHDDLQQQLAAAKFHLSLLGNRVRHDPQQQAIVARVDHMLKDAVEKSRSLSHDLSPAVLYQSNLGQTFEWLARQMQTQHGLTVRVHSPAEINLRTDAMKAFLYKAGQELLFNVVKHARVKEAVIRLRRWGRYVGLSVTDRGRGFDPRELKQATGFGLFGIRERVELLGGRMTIRSAAGEGSTFRVIVPDTTEEERKVRMEESRRLSLSPAPAFSPAPISDGLRLRVLLADDHEVVRQGLKTILGEASDLEVVGEAANGREAVDLAGQLEPDVVIMDVSMPLISGDEATRQIKMHLPATRVVALSMYNEPETIERMRRAGAESYVLKTAPFDELFAAIRGKEPDS